MVIETSSGATSKKQPLYQAKRRKKFTRTREQIAMDKVMEEYKEDTTMASAAVGMDPKTPTKVVEKLKNEEKEGMDKLKITNPHLLDNKFMRNNQF